MPFYEYECPFCLKKITLQRNMVERDENVDCARCGKKAKRLQPAVPAVYRGKGFYCTDNRK